MKRIAFVLILVAGVALAENGPYGAPTLQSYDRLSDAQKQHYVDALASLAKPDFVNHEGRIVRSSFYATKSGMEELRSVASDLVARAGGYSRMLSIGRSGSGILGYLAGRLSGEGVTGVELSDVPFSFARFEPMTGDERKALRAHLERNGLSPRQIAASPKPFLFFDFVYSGRGAKTLLTEIAAWAGEENLAEAVREKVHFHGMYPAEIRAREVVMGIYYASLKEGMDREKPGQKEIDAVAADIVLPQIEAFESLASKVTARRVSADFYGYAGTHGPNAHESFRPEKWMEPFDRAKSLDYADHVGETAFVELFYLVSRGRQDSKATLAKECEAALRTIGD